ncbi:MAG TPA: M14 family metallocarboxypeptidase [Nitrospiria bacterium]|nr:M14 family metallocarboxypeptidase [Nitrospiria bacterium]
MKRTVVKKIRDYREVVQAVDRAAREIPSLRAVEMGAVPAAPKPYPFYHLTLKGAKTGNPKPRPVYIGGGIHGDEPGGVWAVLEFLKRYPALPDLYQRFEFTILPCTNPFGYEHNTRANAAGIDLNRQFKHPSPPTEVQNVKQAVGDRPFLLAMEFHEDVDTPGFYLYELTRDGEPSWGREMIARIGAKYPINRNEEIEGMPAVEGLIHRESADDDFRNMIEQRPDWPQAFYHYANGSRHGFTTETPVHLTREERAEIHLTALDAALRKLWES